MNSALRIHVLMSLIYMMGSCKVYSQTSQGHFLFSAPSLTQSGPEASSFGRYGVTPVNKYRGTSPITLPIHTIDFDGKTLPISIEYLMPGLKPNQEASSVGLGWSLRATAVITRSIKDKDDLSVQDYFGYPHAYDGWIYQEPFIPKDHDSNIYGLSSELVVPEQTQYLIRSEPYKPDLEPDIFEIDLFGEQIKFVLNKDAYIPAGGTNQVIEVTATVLNNRTVKVFYKVANRTFYLNDGKGFRYDFAVSARSIYRGDAGGNLGDSHITSWYLTKITSPRGLTVNYTYDKTVALESTKSFVTQTTDFTRSSMNDNGNCDGPFEPRKGIVFRYWPTTGNPDFFVKFQYFNLTEEVYLSSIGYQNESVVFDYAYDRLDLKSCLATESWYTSSFTSGKKAARLQNIYVHFKLSEASSSLKKQVKLVSSYFNSDKIGTTEEYKWLRLKLDAIQIDEKVFSFDYNSASLLPSKETYSIDLWGYYNGRDQEVLHAPYRYTTISGNRFTSTGVKREASITFSLIGILNKVTYPTGGWTQYTYEPNVVSLPDAVTYTWESDYNMEPSGPYRNKTVGGARIGDVSTYDYTGNKLSGKRFFYNQQNQINSSGILSDTSFSNVTFFVISAGRRTTGASDPDQCMGTGTVDYLIVSSNPTSSNFNDMLGGHVGYSFVKEEEYDLGIPSKSIVTESEFFNEPPVEKWYSEGPLNNPEFCEAPWPGDVNVSKHIGAASGWDIPAYIYRSENGSLLREKLYSDGVLIQERVNDYESLNNGYVIGVKALTGIQCAGASALFGGAHLIDIFQNYRLNVQTYNLWRSTKKVYQNSQVLEEITSFETDPSSWRRKKETALFSTGNKEVSFYYPSDFIELADLVSDKETPVRIEEKVNGKLTNGKIMVPNATGLPASVYRYESVLPVSSSYSANTLIPENYSKVYDIIYYGNSSRIQQVANESGIVTTYFYGYGGRYLVAEIVGASYQQVLGLYPVNQSKLDIGLDNEGRVTELSNLRQAVSAAGHKISTYHHNPVVGVLTIIDSNNVTTSYSYDQFARLKTVRDTQGRIIKLLNYQIGE
jgi:YD repeat-containing protein